MDTRYCEFSQPDSQPDHWSHPQQSVERELHGEFTSLQYQAARGE